MFPAIYLLQPPQAALHWLVIHSAFSRYEMPVIKAVMYVKTSLSCLEYKTSQYAETKFSQIMS
jgi:hypothetical protein